MFHEDFSYAMFIMQSNNVTGWMDGLIEVNDCFPLFYGSCYGLKMHLKHETVPRLDLVAGRGRERDNYYFF